MIKNELINSIKNKSARVGVIGLGYVGLPLATEFAAMWNRRKSKS
jgi:UDP-N-acetyl-D-glucosamine dehydrogenase